LALPKSPHLASPHPTSLSSRSFLCSRSQKNNLHLLLPHRSCTFPFPLSRLLLRPVLYQIAYLPYGPKSLLTQTGSLTRPIAAQPHSTLQLLLLGTYVVCPDSSPFGETGSQLFRFARNASQSILFVRLLFTLLLLDAIGQPDALLRQSTAELPTAFPTCLYHKKSCIHSPHDIASPHWEGIIYPTAFYTPRNLHWQPSSRFRAAPQQLVRPPSKSHSAPVDLGIPIIIAQPIVVCLDADSALRHVLDTDLVICSASLETFPRLIALTARSWPLHSDFLPARQAFPRKAIADSLSAARTPLPAIVFCRQHVGE
jgi:hypothetical protein